MEGDRALTDTAPPGPPHVTAPLDMAAICARLPHRPPALLIDGVADRGPGFAVAWRQVGPDDPLAAPPGVAGFLLAEAMAQACAFAHPIGSPDRPALLAGLSLRLSGRAGPGDRLVLRARLLRARPGLARFDATAEVAGRALARARITLAEG